MSHNVQFEDPLAGMQRFDPRQQAPKGLTGMLIKNGFAKDARGANLLLVAVIIVCVAVSAFSILRAKGDGAKPVILTPDQVHRTDNLPRI